jgi:HEAT repeat protein
VTEDPATEPGAPSGAVARRRRQVIVAGHTGRVDRARRGLADRHPQVQAAAVGALARAGALTVADIGDALAGRSVLLRRSAAHHALDVRGPGSRSVLPALLIEALGDPDPLVAVAASWFLAERRVTAAVAPLAATASGHADVRCREAAVAALGAIGDPRGLPAVLEALGDKATIRRRATVALAGFDDPRVDVALRRAATDRDWQVRQAAEELLDGTGRSGD